MECQSGGDARTRAQARPSASYKKSPSRKSPGTLWRLCATAEYLHAGCSAALITCVPQVVPVIPLFDAVRAADAQVYITADLRHHPASEFPRNGTRVDGSNIALIDCSHAASESLWLQSAANRYCDALLAERGFAIEVKLCITLNADPWDFTVSTGVATGQGRIRQAPPQPCVGTLGREF